MYKIELKPHKAIQRSVFGPIEVEFDQWLIYANGLHVGYVGKQAGAPINIFAELNKSMLQQLKSAIEEHMGAPSPMAVAPTEDEVAEHLSIVNEEENDDE